MNLKEEMEFLASGKDSKIDYGINEMGETPKSRQVRKMAEAAADREW